MTFHDPFVRVKNFDDFGFLRVNVGNFLNLENRPQAFYQAINELVKFREGLTVAHQGGLILPIQASANYYLMAINWLRLNTPINEGIAVSAISSYEDINDSISASFLQFTAWVRDNYLVPQPVWQTIQAQLGIAKADKLKNLDLKANEYEEDFQHSLANAQNRLSESTDLRKTDLENTLNGKFDSQANILRDLSRDAVNNIKQAQALNIWHDAYEKNIERYVRKLEGIDWKPLDWKGRLKNNLWPWFIRGFIFRIKKYRNIANFIPYDFDAEKKELRFLWYAFTRTIKFLYQLVAQSSTFLVSKCLVSARGQRSAWFTILGIVLVGQSLLFLTLLLKGDLKDIPLNHLLSGATLTNLTNNEFVFAKISIFLGLILVPSLGYAFANRNYRIYSNLLEQYRHRATVAQTLQGILRYIDENEVNKDIRTSMTAIAVAAMFEMKNVGHLTKKDGDTLPAAELIQGIMSRK